ncbi:MAG: error-prone DNA polymerase, partial [Thermoflexales bacterium]|nr:error-prone DNA polymerase [Thermoflexales bacterium]
MTDVVGGYAELHAHSYFSLLDAPSSPEALVAEARALGLRALALTDHDSLAGASRFWTAAQAAALPAIIGVELTLEDESHLTLLAENAQGYASLCRLVSTAHGGTFEAVDADAPWPGKQPPRTPWARLGELNAGLIALSGCRRGAVAAALRGGDRDAADAALARLRAIFPAGRLYVELQRHDLPDDDALVAGACALAGRHGLPIVATHNVHYASRSLARLRDCQIAIRNLETLEAARRAGHLPLNSEYALPGPREMAARFHDHPAALRATLELAERCANAVRIDFTGRRLPHFPTPGGETEFAYLYTLCNRGLYERFGAPTAQAVSQLAHELRIIDQAGLAGYFLIVWDIVRYARERGILCQGRGSAANSLVTYALGITAVDPLRHNLLFERFLSADRRATPDIDIDFAADRREEVIQYVYARYGHRHAAMVCNFVTYHPPSAVRDLGKAMGFPQRVIDRLARQEPETWEIDAPAGDVEHPLRQLAALTAALEGCPRHLSIHVGGMIITGPPLDEVVPLERASMPGRVVCEWDKDSVEDAGLIKIDLLSLRTLGLVAECLADGTVIPPGADDPAIYAMLAEADTIGTFQVESRAQQQMLPRSKPATLEDLAVEIAIIRPGPIQGGAVHPYLRRRSGQEPVSYPHPTLEPVLRETLGVLLYQEQCIRMAMVAARFTAGEADALRRAMSRGRSREAMAALQGPFVAGCVANGIDAQTAQVLFDKLGGFATYGFCKSHAASFALIAYQTLWLKRYRPGPFYRALLNHQPMGFYSPEVIIGDARRHGVTILPLDINRSGWGWTLDGAAGAPALRPGLNTVSGFGEAAWQRLEPARPFVGLDDFCRRARLPFDLATDLIRAGAFDALAADRRQLLWALGELDYRADELDVTFTPTPLALEAADALEQVAWEYELLGLSPAGQIMRHHRARLRAAGVLTIAEVRAQEAGRRVRVAAMLAVRQRPPTAHGMAFLSLEDETGLLDVVVRPNVFEAYREILRGERLL